VTPDHDPFAPLDREAPPPSRLKHRVVRSLRDAGVIRPDRSAAWRVAWAAAVLVAAAGGYLAGRGEAPAPADGGPGRYLLLLYQDASFQTRVPEAELVAEYAAWARELAGRGRLTAGDKLGDTARVLGAPSREAMAEPEPVQPGGRVTGFFVVRAPDLAQAAAIARTCPHLRYGGWIVVRPIETT
jgi:hypothetical protein